MFESVGQARDVDRKRQAGSLFTSLAVNGGLLVALILLGNRVVEDRLVVCCGLGETGHLSHVLASCLDHGIGTLNGGSLTESVY
jgi:hypothetical protein